MIEAKEADAKLIVCGVMLTAIKKIASGFVFVFEFYFIEEENCLDY